jgi:uncharacterized RmlC-like cupin family protein
MSVNKKWVRTSAYSSKMEVGPQGQRLLPGINADLAGSTQVSSGLVMMPPGVQSKAHVHNKYEIIIFILEGWAASLVGDDLEPAVQGPGEFVFIPAGVPHLAVNLSTTHRVVGLEVRADPQFNEDVTLLPELDEHSQSIVKELRKKHAAGEIPVNWQQNDATFTLPE